VALLLVETTVPADVDDDDVVSKDPRAMEAYSTWRKDMIAAA